jgi:AbrB family looped-hinge helix DNA binding protein
MVCSEKIVTAVARGTVDTRWRDFADLYLLTRRHPASLGIRWYRFPMETVIDQAGRIVLPKPIRDALGLLPGTKVDISPYGAGAQVVPAGRTARLVEEDGVLVSAGDTPVDDGVVFALIDAGRK